MKKIGLIAILLSVLAGCSGVQLQSPIRLMTAVVNSDDTLPIQFTWTDTRPIGIWFLGSPSRITADNPAGWWDGPDGFDTYFARAKIVTHEINAQAVIIWDIEGESSDEGYIGSPELASTINPKFNVPA